MDWLDGVNMLLRPKIPSGGVCRAWVDPEAERLRVKAKAEANAKRKAAKKARKRNRR